MEIKMKRKKYYYLVLGDLIRTGDEYRWNKKGGKWLETGNETNDKVKITQHDMAFGPYYRREIKNGVA